jgi:hypothetical protein
VTWGTAGIAGLVIAGIVIFLIQPSAKPKLYVTSLQKGEFANVPNACKVLSPALLNQYLGGKPSKNVQTASGALKSECTYQVDAKPTFRVLDVTVQAYAPNLIAPGDGSATSYAVYTFAMARQQLARPPRHTPQPPAKITTITGLGSEALTALQVYHTGSVTDRATVLARYHNVVITASLWATASGGFGPVSISDLRADAMGVARDLLATVKSESAVGS